MSRLGVAVMAVALTGCEDQAEVQDGSCVGVMQHVHRTLRATKTSYLGISINCDRMSAATRSCLGAIKSGADLLACAKDNPTLKEELDRAIANNLNMNQRVAAFAAGRFVRADGEWRSNNPTATTCPTLVQLAQQTISPHIVKDPWGSEYVVRCDANRTEVFSAGPDKKPGTKDDIGAGWVEPQLR